MIHLKRFSLINESIDENLEIINDYLENMGISDKYEVRIKNDDNYFYMITISYKEEIDDFESFSSLVNNLDEIDKILRQRSNDPLSLIRTFLNRLILKKDIQFTIQSRGSRHRNDDPKYLIGILFPQYKI